MPRWMADRFSPTHKSSFCFFLFFFFFCSVLSDGPKSQQKGPSKWPTSLWCRGRRVFQPEKFQKLLYFPIKGEGGTLSFTLCWVSAGSLPGLCGPRKGGRSSPHSFHSAVPVESRPPLFPPAAFLITMKSGETCGYFMANHKRNSPSVRPIKSAIGATQVNFVGH